CHKCRSINLVIDDLTGNTVCASCAVVQQYDNYEAHIGSITGEKGTYVRMGTAGSGTNYSYRDTKIFNARKSIDDHMLRLGISGVKSQEVKLLAEKITGGEYGQGAWFSVFIGACAYVVMRKDRKTLPIAEVADAIGCDECELGRMISRVVDFTDTKLPEFDIVNSFERSVKTCPSLTKVSEEVVLRILQQGVFLLQCLIKWGVTTGRRPMPVVVSVVVFVGKLNGVDVKIEDVAQELHAGIYTCRQRYRELLVILVKVGQILPWGKDVNMKNIMSNAPFVMQYMERKSMMKGCDQRQSPEFDMEELVGDLRKENYAPEDRGSIYFEDVNSDETCCFDQSDRYKFSTESLSIVYAKFLDEVSSLKSGNDGRRICRIPNSRRKGFDVAEWWQGRSELSKKLQLKQILEKDVGFDPEPPSFEEGCSATETRRGKINAAKLRIQRTLNPSGCGAVEEEEGVKGRKRRKKATEEDVDWEDFIIETLLLHGVKEAEIESGHYNVLLDLHVFS
ncbi:hypothetical protein M569_04947, partial [Genlisea aurea]